MTAPAHHTDPVTAPGAAVEDQPALVRRVRLRAERHLLWLRSRWDGDPAMVSPVVILDGEADRIVAERGDPVALAQTFYATDRRARELAEAIDRADREAAEDHRLESFRQACGLDEAEVDLLTLCAALEAAPELRRLYGYLQDDASVDWPTPHLARRLFDWTPGTDVGPSSGLVRWHLARPVDGQVSPWSVSAGWVVDPWVARCLADGLVLDPHLAESTTVVYPGGPEPRPDCIYPAALADAVAYVEAMAASADPIRLALVGPGGAGKRTVATQLCEALDLPLLIVDARALLGGQPATVGTIGAESPARSMARVVRTARLVRGAVYWHDADEVPIEAWREVDGRLAVSIFGSLAAAEASGPAAALLRRIQLPPLSRAERAGLWATLSDRPTPSQVLDWPLLPGEIARVATVVDAGEQAVTDACRATLPPDLGGLASVLRRPYTWEDVVLPPSTRRHLGEFENQARLRWAVYEDWGFARTLPMGRGVAALFAGPSGTGKTMTAQVLARALGMEIYRVDLAGVMSKYIGDTEKHLRRIFDACERANVLLFFDEADALFGQRMPVKDAHDRFANIEIDYLLQRMEEFDGVAILATNRRSEIDPGFLRRVRFIVEFRLPRAPERLALWHHALPPTSPAGEELLEEIDWDFLADKLELTGAGIKAAGLGAAFLARDAGARIGMEHVLHAAKRELAKQGKPLRAGEGWPE